MSSKKIVITSIITILLISIVASIIGWNFRTYNSRFSEQECKRSGSYCVFDGIPQGMMYSKPAESMEGVHEFNGNLEDYVVSIGYQPKEYPAIPEEGIIRVKTSISEISIWNIDNYECKSTGETPEVIEYFSQFCRSNNLGCGEERRAIVCGEGYMIHDTSDYNAKLYGPYDMPETIN